MYSFLCALLLVKLAIITSGKLDCNAIEYFTDYGAHIVFPVDACNHDIYALYHPPTTYKCNDEGTDIIQYKYNSIDYDCSGDFTSTQSMKAYFDAKGINEGNYTMICDKEACPWVIVREYHYNDADSCSYNDDIQWINDDISILDYCNIDDHEYYHQCIDRTSVIYERIDPLSTNSTCANADSFYYNRYIDETDCYYSETYEEYLTQHIICGVGSEHSYSSPPTPSPVDVGINNGEYGDLARLDCNGFAYDYAGVHAYPVDVCYVEFDHWNDVAVPTMYVCAHDGTDIFVQEYGSTDFDCTGDVITSSSMTQYLAGLNKSPKNYTFVCDKEETCPWIKIRTYPVASCEFEVNEDENVFEDELFIAYYCYNTHIGSEVYDQCIDESVRENDYSEDHCVAGTDGYALKEIYEDEDCAYNDNPYNDWGETYEVIHIFCGEGSGDSWSNSCQLNPFYVLLVSFIFLHFTF